MMAANNIGTRQQKPKRDTQVPARNVVEEVSRLRAALLAAETLMREVDIMLDVPTLGRAKWRLMLGADRAGSAAREVSSCP